MSRITKLIEELCPNGVEYKPLSEIADIIRGKRITKKDLTEEGVYPVMSGGVTFMGRYNEFNRQADTITISSYGQAGYIDFIKEKFWANDVCLTVFPKEMIENKFLYYALKNMQNYLYLNTTKAIPDHIPTKFLMELKIPVPPRPIQDEIVRILDNFTELTAELTAELIDRRKQYEYYRDKLLTFEEQKIEWKPLKEIFDIKGGYTPSKDNKEFWDNGTIPWFRIDDINEKGHVLNDAKQHVTENAVKKSGLFKPNSLIITTSATIGEYALIKKSFLCNQRFTCLTRKKEYENILLPEFVMHYSIVLAKFCKAHLNVGSFASVDMELFSNFKYPIPSIKIQQRIIDILDNFDKICNDFEIGLPAEVEMRQKQYEFFRDKLLTFDFNLEKILQTDRQTGRQTGNN